MMLLEDKFVYLYKMYFIRESFCLVSVILYKYISDMLDYIKTSINILKNF